MLVFEDIHCANYTVVRNASRSSAYNEPHFYRQILILNLCIVALCSHCFALCILSYQRQRFRHNQMCVSLMILSSAEAVLNLFVTIDKLNTISGFSDEVSKDAAIYAGVVFWGINALLCCRNWLVALIALARCEAIFRPLGLRNRQIFSKRKTILYAIIMLIISTGMAAVRLLSKKGLVCRHNGHVRVARYLNLYDAYKYFETYAYFIFQSVVPILLVVIGTGLMVYTLMKSQKIRTNKSAKSGHSSNWKATRTILAVSVVFFLMEMPVFVVVITHLVKPLDFQLLHHLFFMGRLCVVADSLCNVGIYVLTDEKFRKSSVTLLARAVHCICCNRRTDPDVGLVTMNSGFTNSFRRTPSTTHRNNVANIHNSPVLITPLLHDTPNCAPPDGEAL